MSAPRHTRWLLAALVLAALTTGALLALGDRFLGRGAALGPALGGIVLVATICIGELRTPRQTTLTRTAGTRPRLVRDYLTRGPAVVAGLGLTALGVALAVGTALGSPDDLGRAGRALTTRCQDVTMTHGPWPGSYYALPIALATLASVVLAVLTCRAIATRPAHGIEGAALDGALRRSSIRSVLLAVALVCWVTLVPVLLFMTGGLLSGGSCQSTTMRLLGLGCAVGTLVALVLAGGTLAALLRPPAVVPGQAPPGATSPVPARVPR